MSPRPTRITDEQILAAAREIFLLRGIRATTAEVARQAGIAEGSIFNRFKTKVDLFKAAMRIDLEDPPFLRNLVGRVGHGDLKQTLYQVGLEIIDFFRAVLPIMMMSWSNPAPSGLPGILDGPNPPPVRGLKRFAGFFEAEMRAKRIRRHDAEIVARAYLGGLQNYVFFEILMGAQAELPLPAETYLRGLVELLWNGIVPVPEPKLKNPRKRRS